MNQLPTRLARVLFAAGALVATGLLNPASDRCFAADNVSAKPARGTAEWALRMYFEETSFPDFADFVTGSEKDYLLSQPPLGVDKPPEVRVAYRLLEDSGDRRIYAVECVGGKSYWDFYCYLVPEDGVWRFTAVRCLAWTVVSRMMLKECEESPAYADTHRVDCGQARLILSSDRVLKKHLTDNLEKFEQVIALRHEIVSLEKRVWGVSEDEDTKPRAELRKTNRAERDLLDELFIDKVSLTEGEGTVCFLVGGLLNNALSYLYIPDGVDPPAMSPDDYIYVEQIVPNWYLAKET